MTGIFMSAWSPSQDFVLKMVGITKSYGNVLANRQITLGINKQEIHSLLGENGAGKSTLMKILYGLEIADEGYIELDGSVLSMRSPADAIAAGIGMVHQHFMLVPTLTVLENLLLGSSLAGKRLLNIAHGKKLIGQLAEKYKIPINLGRVAGQLSVGEQQRVEIFKALVRGAKVLILDEPTAVLTPQETDQLLLTLKDLSSQGISIVLVTHKLREVMAVSDRASVMRSGRLVGTWRIGETTADDLVSEMIGRSRNVHFAREKLPSHEIILQLNEVKADGHRGRPALRGIDFTVHAGEIVGIAGVEGNGQSEIAEAITGLIGVTGGTIQLSGKPIENLSTVEILERGVAHIPEDRHRDGLVLEFSVAENAVLVAYRSHKFRKNGMMSRKRISDFARQLIKDFAIRCPGPLARIGSLSGGNQQKLILGREISRMPKLLIAMQPTRGLDVGAIDYVHGRLVDLRNVGVAILLISTELEEILTLSDRIAVIRNGRIADTVGRLEATASGIGKLMLGQERMAS